MKHSWREWKEFSVCKRFLIGREINSKDIMITGNIMTRVHIINISRGMIGTGRKLLPSEITAVVILGRILWQAQELRYHTITPSLGLIDFGEAKFEEVMVWCLSYEAIKSERMNDRHQ